MKRKIIIILSLLLVVMSFFAGFQTANYLNRDSEPEVSVTLIRETLKDCSNLTTAELEYKGLIKYTEGSISFINKKSFSMVYSAHITAGIDLSKAEISVSSSQVKIVLPATDIQSLNIDTDSLEFYDEEFALFNWTKKEDTSEAVKSAKADAEKNADVTQLKEHAKEQAKTVVKGFVTPLISDGVELVIE